MCNSGITPLYEFHTSRQANLAISRLELLYVVSLAWILGILHYSFIIAFGEQHINCRPRGGAHLQNVLTCANMSNFSNPFQSLGYAQKRVLNIQVYPCDKAAFLTDRLRKGYDSIKMNFRDMGPFQKPLYTHVNIGFDLSDPPPRDYRKFVK